MSVSEVLGALGEWSVGLSDGTPADVRAQLGYFGHVAIVRGNVNVADHGDALLPQARYVGVLRRRQDNQDVALSGSGMLFWLGDEDGKGHVIEAPIVLTNATLTAAVTAVLPPTVTLGTVYPHSNPAWVYSGTHRFQSPREALQIICDAAGVEFRVNGNATVDVGRPDQLYNTTAPDSIVVRKSSGADVDLSAIGGTFDADHAVFDYSTRVLLLGQTTGTSGEVTDIFATGSADAPVVPYKDLRGNTVKMTRVISESGQTEGSVQARAQLQLNRFNRATAALAVNASQYDADGVFVVGDGTYVFDPDSGVIDPAREVFFRGEKLNPDVIRVTAATWPITRGHTVAFRTDTGTWIDLTPWVQWEGTDTGADEIGSSGISELVVGDLPRSLTAPSGNVVQDRVDSVAPADASIPKTPTGLTLTTTAAQDNYGGQIAFVKATWAAVTQNTDNTAIVDLDYYEARYRPQFRAPGWLTSALSDDTNVEFVATPGLVYDVQVRAVDRAGNVSDWSATVSATAATDSVAPPAPADPLVSNYLGQLRYEYIGVDSSANPMPADTASIEVYVGTTSGFFPTASLKVDNLNPFTRGVGYATAPYGSARWVRFVAIDASGNRGPSSAAVSGTTAQVVSADVFDGAVGTAKLADLAVTTAKINLLAVNDAQIGNMAVGKLTAGTMTADVTISGRFATALSGQRVEVNAIGVQAWNSGGTQTMNLNGLDNLLTGRFRTALPGSGVRYVDLGTGGELSALNFVSPDSQTAFVRAYTSGGVDRLDAIQLGVNVPSYTTSDAFGWNVVGVSQQESIFLRSKTVDTSYQTGWSVYEASNRASGTQKQRLHSDSSGLIVSAGGAGVTGTYLSYNYSTGGFDFQWQSEGLLRITAGGGTVSPFASFVAPDGLGLAIRSISDSNGVFMEVSNFGGNAYGGWRASSFNVTSDERGKTAIADWTGDASAAVRAMRVRRYRRREDDAREVIGLVAQELAGVAPQVVIGDPAGDSTLSIDLYQLVTLLIADAKQKDTALTTLRADLSSLRGLLAPKGLTK